MSNESMSSVSPYVHSTGVAMAEIPQGLLFIHDDTFCYIC